jgi:hypothetical protein
MHLLFKPKKFLFRYKYLETTILVLIYISIGSQIYPEDICMLKTQFAPTMFLAIITLFHGLSAGLLAMALMGIVMKFSYSEFDYIYFLKELVLVLIFGEFQFLWNRKIELFATELRYTKEKLQELSDAFYALKLSHDQIERSYVIKPMSLRNALMKIREEFANNSQGYRPFEKFLVTLSKMIDIKSGFIVELKVDGRFKVLAKIGDELKINFNDLLIETALAKKMPIYISMNGKYNVSDYIAVIPALVADKIRGLLVIEKMPFMSFNKDNLSSSAILLNYMFDEIYRVEVTSKMGNFLKLYSRDFRFEAYRLYNIDKYYKMTSTILVLRTANHLKYKVLLESIQKQIRALDSVSDIKLKDNIYVIAVLFIFAHKSSMKGFMERIHLYEKIYSKNRDVAHMIFSIDEVKLIEKFTVEGVI